jgi:hypothetical protein
MNKTTNPFLKQMLTEISRKTTEGRLVDINWQVINEAKKKKTLKKEVAKRPPQEDPNAEDETPQKAAPQPDAAPEPSAGKEDPAGGDAGMPDIGGAPGQEAPAPDAGGAPEAPDAPPSEPKPEDAGQAQDDASKAKAELEKAKAEKDQAEQELQDESYIKLNSHAGTQFLLSKILDHAFKTNTIDALAGEMVGKLKIETPEDMSSFIEELAPFMVIPGMAQLISSMKGLATKQAPAGNPGEEAEQEPQPDAQV